MTVYVVDLEEISTRYTCEWKDYVPMQLKKNVTDDVVIIDGGKIPQSTTPGAFLNFGGTNMYKSRQMVAISNMIVNNKVKDGDYFLYTDAWNPTIIQLRYMLDLLGIDAKIGGLQHAGAYDKWDFLGRLAGDKSWTHYSELALFHALDHCFFATDFHIQMFKDNRLRLDFPCDDVTPDNIIRTGWPMEYMRDVLHDYMNMEKENTIVFPHRIAPEKNFDVFNKLKHALPEYEFVVCQDKNLTKHEYHSIMGKAKVVFSANLQETLGISTGIEGPLLNAIPVVPDRLSYSEMFTDDFKYDSESNIDDIADKIADVVENYDVYKETLKEHTPFLERNFFSGNTLYDVIKRSHDVH